MKKPTTPMLLDYETQSEVSIINPLYTSHHSTKILCMSWGLQGGTGKLWNPGEPIPKEIIKHAKAGGMFGASNARFDREIWEYVGVEDHGFPETFQEQWYCTQAQVRVAGLPSSLDNSARALQLNNRKSANGTALINKCCVPPFSTDPQDYIDLGIYCLQDWVVMNNVAMSVPDLTPVGIADYQLNERVNDRGIRIDRAMAMAAQEYAEEERGEINEKLGEVTCGFVTKCTQYRRVGTWLRECLEDDGLEKVVKMMIRHKTDKQTGEKTKKYSADKTVRSNMLTGDKENAFALPYDVKRVLELMEDAGGSAVSKFKRMGQKACPDDDRVRGILRYAGAPSTLRYTSLGLQVHNFRRDAFTPKYAEFLKEQMLKHEVLRGSPVEFLKDQISKGISLSTDEAKELAEAEAKGEVMQGTKGKPLQVMDTLGRLLRSAIIPEEGKIFVVNDWSSIESRMTALLAGDEDKLQRFRDGEDPYCYEASNVYGRPINKKDDPQERAVGKVIDLALGFLGGVGALMSMATQFKVYIDPEKAQEIVDIFRASSPKIVALGDALLKAAQRAVTNPDEWQVVGSFRIGYYFSTQDGALYCQLPGGTTLLRYPECRFEMKPVPWDETQLRPQLTALKASLTPKTGETEWARHGLWRGIFLENVVQATCAQRLRECNHDCEKQDLPIVFHVHDEIILEVPIEVSEKVAQKLQEIMEFVPEYLKGLPLEAKPEIMERYGK